MPLLMLTLVVPSAALWTVKLLAVPASPDVHDRVPGVIVAPEPEIVMLPAAGEGPLRVTVPVVDEPVAPVGERESVAVSATLDALPVT